MKKVITFVLVGVLSMSLMGCMGSSASTDTNAGDNNTEVTIPDEEQKVEIDMTLEEIIDKIYETSGLELPNTMKQAVNAENMIYMLGVDNFDYLEGVASEPMMSSIAHSVVLLKVDEKADIDTIKADIKSNVDGQKWICVGVDDDNIRVENVGEYIILVMDQNAEQLIEAFNTVMQ